MEMRGFVLAIALTGVFSVHASAQQVADVSDIVTFEGQDNHGATNVNIRQYSSSIAYGGGQFILGPSGCTSDHGVVLQDHHSPANCYYRQFSGPVHLSWYGAMDATQGTCVSNPAATGCDSLGKLNAALAAALPSANLGGDGGVDTDGRSVIVNSGTLLIGAKQYLTCDGPPGGQRQQKGGSDVVPYNTLPSSIILDFGGSAHHTITVSEHAALSSCIVRPSWYNGNLVSAIGSTRDIVDNIEHKLAGTCVTATGPGVNLHDLFVIGCDTGIELNSAGLSPIANVNIEGNVGIYNHDNGGGMKLQNISIHNFLEQFDDGSGNSIRESDCPITARLTGTVAVA